MLRSERRRCTGQARVLVRLDHRDHRTRPGTRRCQSPQIKPSNQVLPSGNPSGAASSSNIPIEPPTSIFPLVPTAAWSKSALVAPVSTALQNCLPRQPAAVHSCKLRRRRSPVRRPDRAASAYAKRICVKLRLLVAQDDRFHPQSRSAPRRRDQPMQPRIARSPDRPDPV